MRELNSLLSIFAKLNTISAIVLFAALFYFAPMTASTSEASDSNIQTTENIKTTADALQAKEHNNSALEF